MEQLGLRERLFGLFLQPSLVILKGNPIHTNLLGLMNNRVLDGAKLFLLRQRDLFQWFVLVVALHLMLQFQPLPVAFVYGVELGQFVHNLIHQLLLLLRKITIGSLSVVRKLFGQFHELFFQSGTVSNVVRKHLCEL